MTPDADPSIPSIPERLKLLQKSLQLQLTTLGTDEIYSVIEDAARMKFPLRREVIEKLPGALDLYHLIQGKPTEADFT